MDFSSIFKMKNITQLKKEMKEFEKKFNGIELEKYPRESYRTLKSKLQTLQEVCEGIEKKIQKLNEDIILWKKDYGRDGKPLNRKGYFKNKDFEIIANAQISELKELLKKFQGEEK